MRKRQAIGAVILFFVTPIDAGAANALDQGVAGAWAQSASDCKEVFETRDGGVRFRRPTNTFISAFIIRGRNVEAVNGSCHINDTSPAENGYLRMKLECQDAISFLPLDARIKILSATQMSYGDFSSDPTIDSTYQRCAP